MIELKRGDVFASRNPQGVGKLILGVTSMTSADGEAQYGHTGIVLNPQGATFEARWSLDVFNLSDYKGERVIIARPNATTETVEKALEDVLEEHRGQSYPWWRLVFHLVPPVARKVSYKGKFVVCSEKTAKYLFYMGLRHRNYAGTSPDMLVDEWRKWRDFDVVYEGIWK